MTSTSQLRLRRMPIFGALMRMTSQPNTQNHIKDLAHTTVSHFTFLLYFLGVRLCSERDRDTATTASSCTSNSMATTADVRSRTSLIVHNLDRRTAHAQLLSLFSTVGEVQSVRIIRDRVRGPSTYGFVNFKYRIDAARAVETLNRRRLRSNYIRVSYARQRGPTKDTTTTTVDVLTLDQMLSSMVINDVVVKEKPSPAGANGQQAEEATTTSKQEPTTTSKQEPTTTTSKQEPTTTTTTTTNPALSDQLCSGSSSRLQCEAKHHSDGKERLTYRRQQQQRNRHHHSRKSEQHQPPSRRTAVASPRIFVHNLGRDCDEDELRRRFENFGVVTDLQVFRDRRTNKCRGLAFVSMATRTQAALAVARLHGQRFGKSILGVSFKVQEYKHQRHPPQSSSSKS